MKEKLFIIGIIITTLSAYSQSSKIKFGLKGGMNFFNIRIEQPKDNLDPEINSDFNTGFFVGTFISYEFNNKIKIQIEPNFQIKQTEISVFIKDLRNSENSQRNDYSEKNKFSEYSIETPLISRFLVNKKIHLEAGFNFIYTLKQEENRNIVYGSLLENNSTSTEINEFRTGIIIGGIYNTSKNIGLNLRYNYDLSERGGVLLNGRTINIGIEYEI